MDEATTAIIRDMDGNRPGSTKRTSFWDVFWALGFSWKSAQAQGSPLVGGPQALSRIGHAERGGRPSLIIGYGVEGPNFEPFGRKLKVWVRFANPLCGFVLNLEPSVRNFRCREPKLRTFWEKHKSRTQSLEPSGKLRARI